MNAKSILGISIRELQILDYLAKGLTAKETADKLHISTTTVITHRDNLRKKLGCKNCPELIYHASRLKLI